MEHPFNIGPEHLPFPNGGGLKAMSKKSPKSQQLEVEALEAKYKADMAKLKEKHATANKPKPISIKIRKKKNVSKI